MEPRWLTHSRSFLGIKEVPGPIDNKIILAWAGELGIPAVAAFYVHDSIPWCGLFQGKVFRDLGYKLPANPLGALNWSTWGQALAYPALGAVATFRRAGEPGAGHVAQLVGQDDSFFYTLGGNQSDAVTANDKIPKDRLVAMRWPLGEVLPPRGTLPRMSNGVVQSAS